MDDEAIANGNGAPSPPCVVSVSALSGSRRRLSTSFVERSRLHFSSSEKLKPMAWVSLQGRLLNADEASSARTIGGGVFSAEQAIAWNLFPPIHRFLLVAVIGAAVARSRKDFQICQLKNSVQLRDQVLLNMQQKLDSLCELVVNNSKEHSTNKSCDKDGELQLNETLGAGKINFIDCGCWHCEQHSGFFNELMEGASIARSSGANEVLQYKMPFSNEDQEERRMSDMSDWASSVTSSADIQLNNLAVEQDMYNLRRDSEEKDTTIKELTSLLNSNEVANCKRIAELEDFIRRKNATISKLKKDMLVLEQKVVQLTRLRRPSFSASGTNDGQPPHIMIDNLLYDMESTTSPSSSSDSDSSSVVKAPKLPTDVVLKQDFAPKLDQNPTPAKVSSSSGRVFERHSKSRSVSPRKEVSSSQKSNAASASAQKLLSARGDLKKNRRRSLNGDKSATAPKGWV
ncbi:hypothetical protein AAZX31_13G323200 [Glycine max]|uniref:Uncharacterized protein n=1 Tax=Glycine max TaxID=3847 RepID=I1M529_SOYBN|nr:uncharacterized protein LOC100803132 [Glycine max]KAG5114819.1 hypothetical protein JHK82_038088 [Glycine max]KAG5132100.1 hypothetical protein JHK84_038497 [Glycine max]KAH1104811.1 hypothetical protein GYH30_038248 [Glycine max]KAH1219204.1 hypothetical protein GmHk_13G039393 [Glycine max]KRH23161.1 hypothetical protein GLYMA_13G341800v4 [Glycine max]|eukprot:XP_006595048.1 uncharacterized protein LOC100803132 [Glycine max]